jgi:hypothetical protein
VVGGGAAWVVVGGVVVVGGTVDVAVVGGTVTSGTKPPPPPAAALAAAGRGWCEEVEEMTPVAVATTAMIRRPVMISFGRPMKTGSRRSLRSRRTPLPGRPGGGRGAVETAAERRRRERRQQFQGGFPQARRRLLCPLVGT